MIEARKEIRYLPIFLMLMLVVFSAICVYFYFRSTSAVYEVLRVQVDEASSRTAKDIEENYNEAVRELSFLTRNDLLPILYSNTGVSVSDKERRGAKFSEWFRGQTNKEFNLIAFVDSEATSYTLMQLRKQPRVCCKWKRLGTISKVYLQHMI